MYATNLNQMALDGKIDPLIGRELEIVSTRGPCIHGPGRRQDGCTGAEPLGKPADRAGGEAMLGRLSGRRHEVMTAICLASEAGFDSDLVVTEVEFVALDKRLVDAYLDTEEPWDKAGAYGIQGMAAVFVKGIEGSYSNVVGLPLHETWSMLRRAGFPTPPEAAAL